ncbi:MAG: hypothetical protein AB9903_36165 [Vulcanimicrobiota bacterium]
MRKTIFTVCLLVMAVAVLGFCAAGCGKHYKVVTKYSGDAARNMLLNRPWMDEFPAKPEQKFTAYVFSDEMVGVHDKADSAYRHLLEIFTFRVDPEKILYLFPHDQRKADSGYKIEKIQGGQFNLKLTLMKDPQLGGKTYVYFSHTEWDVKNTSTIPMQVRSAIRALR